MRISKRDFDLINRPIRRGVTSEQAKAREAKRRSDFVKLCDERNRNPHTVRKRMRPHSRGGQGMTLEEALSAPVLTHAEAGRRRPKRLTHKKETEA